MYPKKPDQFAFEWSTLERNWRKWPLVHLYSLIWPFEGRTDTLEAAYHSWHYTQTAGMVRLNPMAGELIDRCGSIIKTLRLSAFQRFGYDPDHYFEECGHYRFGFVPRASIDRPAGAPFHVADFPEGTLRHRLAQALARRGPFVPHE